jgi:hypothetical protein
VHVLVHVQIDISPDRPFASLRALKGTPPRQHTVPITRPRAEVLKCEGLTSPAGTLSLVRDYL